MNPGTNGQERTPGTSGPASGGNGGNGGLTRHRLTQLEGRMDRLEGKVDQLVVTCTKIETKLGELATKSYVLRWFGITAAVLTVTLVGHVFLRALG